MKKSCTQCGVKKEEEEFIKDKRRKYGRGSSCKKCMNQYYKKYYEKNVQKVNDSIKKYREKNFEKVKEFQRKYREKNSEKLKERGRKYYKENPEKEKERGKKYYEKNVEKVKESHKKYYEKNTEKFIYNAHIRRTLYNRGLVTQQFIKELRANTIICECCNQPIEDYHLDHIIQVNLGGEFIPENMRYICETCNLKRPKFHFKDIDKKRIKMIIKAMRKFLKDWMKKHPIQSQNWKLEYPELWKKSVKLYDLT